MATHTLESLNPADRAELTAVVSGIIAGGIDAIDFRTGYRELRSRLLELQRRLETEIPKPAEPEGKKYVGRWFQSTSVARHTLKVVEAGEHGVQVECLACPGRRPHVSTSVLSDSALYVEVPPKPDSVPAGYELTGEVRVPTANDQYWMTSRRLQLFNTNINGPGYMPELLKHFSGYRWIVRKIAPKYRPFENAAECKHLIGKTVRVIKAPRSVKDISGITKDELWFDADTQTVTFEEALAMYELLDGTPLGVKIQ